MIICASSCVTSSGLSLIRNWTILRRQKHAALTYATAPVAETSLSTGLMKSFIMLRLKSTVRYSGNVFSRISIKLVAHPLATSSLGWMKKYLTKNSKMRTRVRRLLGGLSSGSTRSFLKH